MPQCLSIMLDAEAVDDNGPWWRCQDAGALPHAADHVLPPNARGRGPWLVRA